MSSSPTQSSQRSRSSSGGSTTYLEVPPRSRVETLLAQFLSDLRDAYDDEKADENANVSEEVTALAEASDKLLNAVQSLGANEAASLIKADPAILEVGPSGALTLAGSSKRLLALIQNVANHPDSNIATDPAIVHLGPASARGPTEGQTPAEAPPLSLGDREILRDVRELRASYREKARKLLLIIRSLPPRPRAQRGEPAVPEDPSIVRAGPSRQVSHEGQGPRGDDA